MRGSGGGRIWPAMGWRCRFFAKDEHRAGQTSSLTQTVRRLQLHSMLAHAKLRMDRRTQKAIMTAGRACSQSASTFHRRSLRSPRLLFCRQCDRYRLGAPLHRSRSDLVGRASQPRISRSRRSSCERCRSLPAGKDEMRRGNSVVESSKGDASIRTMAATIEARPGTSSHLRDCTVFFDAGCRLSAAAIFTRDDNDLRLVSISTTADSHWGVSPRHSEVEGSGTIS